MSHRKSDLGIPRPRKSAKVVLGRVLIHALRHVIPTAWGWTHEAAQVHYAARRRGGDMAARGARAAARGAGDRCIA
jgi:hypothetical protein